MTVVLQRVLSVEGDAPPPPAKRSESTAGGRRLTGGTSDLPCAPPLAHTRSSPAMSRPHVVSTTSSASVPSLASTSASTSFLHATAAPSAPYNSPAASFSSAVAAGLHLPFGSDVGQDPSSLTAFTSSLPHAPVMPSPLSGSMISSQDSAPQAASGRQHATQSDSIPGHSGFAGTDAPSFAQPESVALQRGHSHTKSWGFSSINDSLLSPVSADAPRSASATSSAPRTTRTRSSTIGAQPSSFSRPPSPIDELYMPAGVGGDISSELKESMNTVFVEWLQTLCNDCQFVSPVWYRVCQSNHLSSSGCHRLERGAHSSNLDGKAYAETRRGWRIPTFQIPNTSVHQSLQRRAPG